MFGFSVVNLRFRVEIRPNRIEKVSVDKATKTNLIPVWETAPLSFNKSCNGTLKVPHKILNN